MPFSRLSLSQTGAEEGPEIWGTAQGRGSRAIVVRYRTGPCDWDGAGCH
jgi:hypothetical protein